MMGFYVFNYAISQVPWSSRQIPNVVTSIRILLVAPIAVALASHRLTLTLALFGVAACSDAVDGFLAKRYAWQSRLGGVLDPIADKLLLTSVLVTLVYLRLVPIWLMVVTVIRDAIIVVGALLYKYCFKTLEMRPTLISKFNTLCQAVFVIAVVAREEFVFPLPWMIALLGALVFVIAVISGIDYVLTYGRQAANLATVAGAARNSVQRS